MPDSIVLVTTRTATDLPLSVLTLILLGTAVLIVLARTARRAVWLLVVQSIALAGIALVVALLGGRNDVYLSVVVTLAVKAVLVPGVLLTVLRRSTGSVISTMYLGRRVCLIVALTLVLLAYALVRQVSVAGTLLKGPALPTAVALILVGGLIMIVRTTAVVQIIGLIVIENGVYAAAIATTFGLPPIVELGVTADLLCTVILLGILAFHIDTALDSLDTRALRRLRH